MSGDFHERKSSFYQRIPTRLSQGYEDKLTDCQYASYDDCGADEAAGVVCEDGGIIFRYY